MLDRLLHHFEPFAQLDWASLATLARHARVVRVAPGRRMVAERIARGRYYLCRGKVRARGSDGATSEIVATTERARWPLLGGLALVGAGLPANLPVEIVTLTPCSLVWVDSAPIDFLLDGAPLAGYHVGYLDGPGSGSGSGSGAGSDWRERLLGAGIGSLAPRMLKALFDSFAPRVVRAGEAVLDEGAAANAFFVIARGSAEVWRGGRRLARLEAGDTFGEDALLSGRQRNASVRMTADGELMSLDAATFDRLLGSPLIRWVRATDIRDDDLTLDVTGEPRNVLAIHRNRNDVPIEPIVLTGGDRGTRALWAFVAACRGVPAVALANDLQAGTVLSLAQVRRLSMASARNTDNG